MTAPASANANSRNKRAGQALGEADRGINRGERDRHRKDGAEDLAHAADGGVERLFAVLDMAVDVLDDHDRVVDDEADGEHHREHASED